MRAETGHKDGSVKRVADQLDIGVESLRSWVHQDEVDHGERPGTSTADAERIRELEQENKELRRANAILRSGGCRRDFRRAVAWTWLGEGAAGRRR